MGIATVFLIVVNIRLQREELRASLSELKRSNESSALQSFEQSLFAWLGNYHQLLNAAQVYGEPKGRFALSTWYENHFSSHVAMRVHYQLHVGDPSSLDKNGTQRLYDELRRSLQQDSARRSDIEQLFQTAKEGYAFVYREHRSDLDAVLRTLYRLIRWIDRTPHLSDEQKWHYVALVRAQLSWIEMVFLLYNSLTTVGASFAELINKYALFDNLDVDAEPLISMIAHEFMMRPPLAFTEAGVATHPWPLSERAFSSDDAKAALGISDKA